MYFCNAMNSLKATKIKTVTGTTKLPLVESFLTLQGEGFHQGRLAWFIRLAGCDVGCNWCDTKESWYIDNNQAIPIDDLISKKYDAELAIITGGEPLMHNLDQLTEELIKNGYKTHLETSGAHKLSGRWDWISFSPKKSKEPQPEVAMYANELKIVVYNKSDLNWALKWSKEVSENCKLYLQPEWSVKEKILPLIMDFIQEYPEWRISLQAHKYLNLR